MYMYIHVHMYVYIHTYHISYNMNHHIYLLSEVSCPNFAFLPITMGMRVVQPSDVRTL